MPQQTPNLLLVSVASRIERDPRVFLGVIDEALQFAHDVMQPRIVAFYLRIGKPRREQLDVFGVVVAEFKYDEAVSDMAATKRPRVLSPKA